ncbi:MAG: DUF1064 domain-containing protein [Lysobacter sp.]|nr:DUF1064 domain-containing protein [Lysobacter sp.]
MRFGTVDELPPGLRDQARAALAGIPKPVAPSFSQPPASVVPLERKPRNKFGAVVTHVDGIRFDSKREARYFEQLQLRIAAGEVRYFLRQVPFHLPGGTKLVVDFLEFHADGSVHVVDVKGRETPVFRLKKREVEHHYPITVELA